MMRNEAALPQLETSLVGQEPARLPKAFRLGQDDVHLIRPVFGHPKVWPWLIGDLDPDFDDVDWYGALGTETVWFIGCLRDDDPSRTWALFMYREITPICYEVHSAAHPDYWNSGYASRAGIASLIYVFDTIPNLNKVTTPVPTDNMPALWLAESVGMRREGINRQSFLRNGEILDQYLLGITKEELQCQL